MVDRCWSSFFAAIKEYRVNPDKFKGRPNLPRYKDKVKGRSVVIYPAQAVSKRGLKKGLLQPSGTNISIPTKILSKVDEIRLVPKCGFYVLEAVYELDVAEPLDQKYIAAIDLGLTNLATIGLIFDF
ncbi:hypothetical protein [Nostoc sp. CHAB 5715]|uniref:hypothetical protein n=1 Tax=Nostoc sp. CHAB 5715 TaxID=2780400 RepID=UPI001E5E0D8E|nr:hypothetical protein [Nostoc sp. CHAB 5715]MCC5625226.1 hypothetical protein [Nostoc sp. CHAB 5715]